MPVLHASNPPAAVAPSRDELQRILRLEVPIIVKLAERKLNVHEVMRLGAGAIIEFFKASDEPLQLLVNNKVIGVGEAVKVGENFGLRISQIGDVKTIVECWGGRGRGGVSMRILAVESEPFHSINYRIGLGLQNAHAVLPFHRAIVEGLPDALDAIIGMSDLQGFESKAAEPRWLAFAVADEIQALQLRGVVPAKSKTGIVLAGDLQPLADEQDVSAARHAFGKLCRWVAGVAGNHDAFGIGANAVSARGVLCRPFHHFLDGDMVIEDGIRIAGISGIIGAAGGAWCRSEGAFSDVISQLAQELPDLLIAHNGPNIDGTAMAGWPSIRKALERVALTMVIRGHDHWAESLGTLRNGTQVLNVEGRVVVMLRE